MTDAAHTDYQSAPVDYLTRVARLFGGYKRRALEFLELRPGEHLLDAGCGAGDDLLALAGQTRGAVTLYGVDREETSLAAARERAKTAGVQIDFRCAELSQLPFETHSLDVVRSDRVFQHLTEPAAALREMIRVTRPGGRVVAVDVDWGTLVLDHPDPVFTDRLCAFGRDHHPNGRSGRRLHAWFREAGLEQVEGYADAVCVTDWEVAVYIWGLRVQLNRMVSAGYATSTEADAWWAAALAYARDGRFCGSMTGFVIRGRVPAGEAS